MKKELTQAILHQLVLYHPTTGIFTKPDGSYLSYSVNIGRVVVSLGKYGHFKSHRLAFLFMEGKWPEHFVDHIDGNPLNNAWCNLRHATQSQNQQNRRSPNKKNSTGFLGVSRYHEKFVAEITISRVRTSLGVYDTAEEAHEVYIKVKRELHPFGEL